MTTNADIIAAVLDDTPKHRKTIAEESGLDLALASATLSAMRKEGRAERTEDGWTAPGSATKSVRKAERPAAGMPVVGVAVDVPRFSVVRDPGYVTPKKASNAPIAEPNYWRFSVGDDARLSLRPPGGGDAIVMDAAGALKLADFLILVRPVIEAWPVTES